MPLTPATTAWLNTGGVARCEGCEGCERGTGWGVADVGGVAAGGRVADVGGGATDGAGVAAGGGGSSSAGRSQAVSLVRVLW